MGPIKKKRGRSFWEKHKEKHKKWPNGATWRLNDILNER